MAAGVVIIVFGSRDNHCGIQIIIVLGSHGNLCDLHVADACPIR